jgi:DNA-binding protein H-NS
METKVIGYKELLAQRAALEQQIEEIRLVEREDVIAEILEKMALYGMTLGDLGKTDVRKSRSARGPVEAKYQDPSTGVTWSGRGRAPRWMDGQDRSHFLIK